LPAHFIDGGAGVNPAPTVKVWMGEEFEAFFVTHFLISAKLLQLPKKDPPF
jgi:hypothetical protein